MFVNKCRGLRTLITLILFACTLYPAANLVASGCETIKTYAYENAVWNDVYYDKYGISFLAKLPTYQGSFLHDDSVFLLGSAEASSYRIEIYAFSPYFPKSGKEFKKLAHELFPGASVDWLNAKKIGAKYAIKLSQKSGGKIVYSRFIFAKTNFISLQTDDTNEVRRNNFFDGFKVY